MIPGSVPGHITAAYAPYNNTTVRTPGLRWLLHPYACGQFTDADNALRVGLALTPQHLWTRNYLV